MKAWVLGCLLTTLLAMPGTAKGGSVDNKKQHEKFLYPVVRVFANQTAGSGTVIYSKPDPQNEEAHLTFVLTNQHVVEGLIEYKDDWDSLLKKKVEKEFKSRAKVEIFSYVNDSTVDSILIVDGCMSQLKRLISRLSIPPLFVSST